MRAPLFLSNIGWMICSPKDGARFVVTPDAALRRIAGLPSPRVAVKRVDTPQTSGPLKVALETFGHEGPKSPHQGGL